MKALLIVGVVGLMTLVGCATSPNGQPIAANNADPQGQAQQASAQQDGVPPLGAAKRSH
jgi:hypothetical protein